jgi:hypothetical protein
MKDRKELNQVIFNDLGNILDQQDRIFYMRAILGLIAGIVTGFIIGGPGTDQNAAGGTVILIAMIFYILSYGVAKNIARNIPQAMSRKLATNGIFPFIFLLLMFMIIVYTGLHQKVAG